jgi:capsular polysaccharide biosynthesis protein
VPRGIFMCGNGASNYYHFLIEILPRLRYLLGDPLMQNYPLLVDESVAREPNWREALDTVSGGHPCLVLPAHRSYRVGNLLYVSTPNALPFNLRADIKVEVGHALTRPSTIEFLRERFGVGAVSASSSQYAHMPKRIFLARRPGGVRNYNQEEIAAVLESFGFVTMHMDALPVAQQARLMSNADMVAGGSGAAWSNLAFIRPGAKCLCWNADRGFSAFCNLAQAAGAELKYLFYDTDVVSTRELYKLDYRLDPDAVRSAIQQLGG